jgi:predicted RND superfamily exporter protein
VRQFGIGSAVGIMVDFAISVVFMPTVLAWAKPEVRHLAPHERHLLEPLRRVARFSSRRPGLVLGVAAAIGAVTIAGISKLYVDTNHINFFSAKHPLSTSAAVIDSHLSGIYSFNILLEGPEDSLKSPEAMERMERVARELRALPYVKKVTSVADYVKRINRELHDGDPAASVIPADRFAIAQELFVFGMSDRGRAELERVVASDYSRAQISVKLASMSSDLVFAQIERAEEIVRREFAGSGIRPTVTGSGRLFATLDHYLVSSQVSSFGTAFLTVFGVIFLVFRSARYGVLAIIPNLFPVLAVLGIMGWLGISMNVATVMVASVALGVVDDDTIHFINRFRRDRERGATVDRAIEAATIFEGRAALTTAIINSAGYGVLLMSEYRPSAWFGGLLALTMATAFLAEVFVLPAAIKLVPWFQGESVTVNRRGTENAEVLN